MRLKPRIDSLYRHKQPQLASSPLTGEDRGEGEILSTPYPSLLPQGEKEHWNPNTNMLKQKGNLKHACRRKRELLYLTQRQQNLLWRNRQRSHPHSKRVVDGISDSRCNGDDGGLRHPFRTEWTRPVTFLQHRGIKHFGNVLHHGQAVLKRIAVL